MKKRKGSFTIEAVIIIPFILFLLISFLEVGICFYQDSCNRACSDSLKRMDTISKFYFLQGIEKIGKEI